MNKALFACLLLAASTVNATIITIEPDDFKVGEQITSEYAIVSALSGYERHPVYASLTPGDGFQAPTGDSMFTSDPNGVVHGWAAADRDGPWFGLYFEFLVPVYEIKLYALNLGYSGLGIECMAYGENWAGGCLGTNRGTAIGESLAYTFTFEHAIDRLLVGGGNTTAAIGFDRLEAHVVPEPSTLALATIGLLGMGGWSRRKQLANIGR